MRTEVSTLACISIPSEGRHCLHFWSQILILSSHSSAASNNSHLLTEWLVNKPLLWSISLGKQWYTVQCSFLSLSSKLLLVLDVSCKAVWNILWCLTQDVVTCMHSLVDNTQFYSWMNNTTVHRQRLWLAHWQRRSKPVILRCQTLYICDTQYDAQNVKHTIIPAFMQPSYATPIWILVCRSLLACNCGERRLNTMKGIVIIHDCLFA